MNVLFISGVLDISFIYKTNMDTLITPSMSAIKVSDVIMFLRMPAIKSGSQINITSARRKAIIIENVMMILSTLSPNFLSSHFSKAEGSYSSSSSKKDAEYMRVFMPITMDSTKAKEPLMNGILASANLLA